MMKRRSAAVTVLLLAALSSSAQHVWSLEECISTALDRNVTFLRQENAVMIAKAGYSGSVADVFIPTLEAGSTMERPDGDLSLSFCASYSILDGLSKYSALKAEKAALEISVLERESLKDDLSVKVARAYVQLLLSKRLEQDAALDYNSILEQRGKIRKEVDAGKRAPGELYEIESRAATELFEQISAHGKTESDRLTLLEAMGIPYEQDFDICSPEAGNLPDIRQLPGPEEIAMMARQQPRVRKAAATIEKCRAQRTAAIGALLPTLDISYSGAAWHSESLEGGFAGQVKESFTPRLALTLAIPLSGGAGPAVRLQQSRLAMRSVELDNEREAEEVYCMLRALVIEAQVGYGKCIAAETGMKAAAEALRVAQTRMENGVIPMSEYNTARNNYAVARSQWHQARFQYMFGIKILDYYRGLPLTL